MSADIWQHSNSLEECYDFMLAYAAQGLPGEEGKAGKEIREVLNRAATTIAGLAEGCAQFARNEQLEPSEKYHAFISVLDRDARDSVAAIALVLSQPFISSQLVDTLNASIHLRAVLTDFFLIGEIFRSRLAARPDR
jgi:hypothetical protein